MRVDRGADSSVVGVARGSVATASETGVAARSATAIGAGTCAIFNVTFIFGAGTCAIFNVTFIFGAGTCAIFNVTFIFSVAWRCSPLPASPKVDAECSLDGEGSILPRVAPSLDARRSRETGAELGG